jgi:hypothetical protein
LITGQMQLGLRLARIFLPLVAISAALWLFVGSSEPEQIAHAMEDLLRSGSPFLLFVRALVGSAAVVLAWATMEDGAVVVLLRQLGVPPSLAFMLASGGIMAASVADGQSKSITALRAQGLVTASILSRIRNIGLIVSLTWTAALNTVVVRAECVWAGNRLFKHLDPERLPPRPVSVLHSLMFAGIALLLVLIVCWKA